MKCATCNHGIVRETPDGAVIVCKEASPQIVMLPRQSIATGGMQMVPVTVWPSVAPDEYCSRWQLPVIKTEVIEK